MLLFVHLLTLLTAICRLFVAVFTLLPVASNAVLSANVAVVIPSHFGMSPVYDKYRIGLRTLFCGTPAEIYLAQDNHRHTLL